MISGIPNRMAFTAGLASILMTLAACNPASKSPRVESGTEQERPAVAGARSSGPFGKLDDLSAAASGGGLVWLAEGEPSRLRGIDGDKGETVIDRELEVAVNDPDGLVDGGGDLWAIGGGKVLRIDTKTGATRSAAPIEGDRGAYGHVTRQGDRLVVADYQRGIVGIDPTNGSARILAPANVPWLLAVGPGDTYWVVEDAERKRLLRLNSRGEHVVETERDKDLAALVADQNGNAWFSHRTGVAAVSPAGEVIAELAGFTNVTTLLNCGGTVVASDVETGELAWLDSTGRQQRVPTGHSGRALGCAGTGVWFLTADGYLARVSEPSR